MNRLRYPGQSLSEVTTKIGRFNTVLDRFGHVQPEIISAQIYKISSRT